MEPLVTSSMSLQEIQAFFAGDRFATNAGCVIVSAAKGHAICEMPITGDHNNGMGRVMGGAIFTLADFSVAVACNIDEEPTVSVSNTIEYLSGVKGSKLIAECVVDKSGSSLGFYTVDVTDDTGRNIARMTATCYRRP